ncbi:MarR family transcriptional regulator [Clostridium sp. C8-1-8]|uniref:MarR family winged helix-turn-helix transcriptional regulator n=1 Tax=Clostridium sp. C8-1-8 TaxID=2698831 RepID=UPI001368DA9C|nr:MarR family transcriptional regulator [Clostridium sp. C8-1-8]
MRSKFHNLLIRTMASHSKRSQSQFMELGLSPGQPKILEVLKDMDGCMQKELAAACNVEPATITSILPSMEKNELITRKSKSYTSGKRSLSVSLTEKGRAMEKDISKIVDQVEELSFQGFAEEEKELFLSMLERVYENIK